jgi:hypothetical protein
MRNLLLLLCCAVGFISCTPQNESFTLSHQDSLLFVLADENGTLANQGFIKCKNFVKGWLQYRDSASGLIPRNINESKDFWNAKDAAADNYPFMVLTSFFVDSVLFNDTMVKMLESEKRLTSRVRSLPDTYSFSRQGFLEDTIKMDEIAFGASEYIKDGLLPLTEWLGESKWSVRMIEMLKDLHKEIEVAGVVNGKGFGNASREEVNGEMLQVLSRMFWMTGDKEFLDWAVKIGDYYLLGDHHPTHDLEYLRLRDHGCELISGLCELYATTHFALPEKKKTYQQPLTEMLDRILEVGRNEDGMFYNGINPKTGQVVSDGLADTWGYTLNGFYTVYMIDKNQPYKDAVLKVFSNLHKYKNYDWEHGSADGYADAIESALNLYNRIPDPAVAEWIDSEIKVMWAMQQASGIIEGWHGDGNFARTTIMYNLWKSKGVYAQPWRSDLTVGAEQIGDTLLLTIKSDKPWKGKLFFDHDRFKDNMKLPMDWPRINQFPQWYSVDNTHEYNVTNSTDKVKSNKTGEQLKAGISLELTGEKKFVVF